MELNREHVIPKSMLKGHPARNEPTNIIPFPARLNSARSNLPYTHIDKGRPVWPCADCCEPHCPLVGFVNKNGFSPPPVYRPVIVKSVTLTMGKFPDIADMVEKDVLSRQTIDIWDSNSNIRI